MIEYKNEGKYFNKNEFLHYELVTDLTKKYDIYLDKNKLCIEIDGVITKDEGGIRRLIASYDRKMRVKHLNEVIRYLKIYAQPIEFAVIPTSITPTLLGERMDNSKQIRAWCPYCAKFHYHGDTGNDKEYRAAHCINETPFTKTGYILKIRKGG